MWLRHKKSTHWPKAVITNVVSHITSKNSIIFFHLEKKKLIGTGVSENTHNFVHYYSNEQYGNQTERLS